MTAGTAGAGTVPAGTTIDVSTVYGVPAIGSPYPLDGGVIDRTDMVEFQITDGSSGTLAKLCSVKVRYANGRVETVFDNGAFTALFARGSSRVDIVNGVEFYIRRTGGWTSTAFRVEVYSPWGDLVT